MIRCHCEASPPDPLHVESLLLATGPLGDTGTVGRKIGTSLGIPWGALPPKAAYRENATLHLRGVQLRGQRRQAVPRVEKMWGGQGS